MTGKKMKVISSFLTVAMGCLVILILWMLWEFVPEAHIRWGLAGACAGLIALTIVWRASVKRQVDEFADTICEILDGLIAGEPENWPQVYEDTLMARVQGKLLQFYDIADESRKQSMRDKKTIQELVSDISHQVKTPVANIRMFAGILKEHELPEEQRKQFLDTMEGQIGKLDFLMQSLIKMSRLETGTFVLHPEQVPLKQTLARAISQIWAQAEKKNIEMETVCDETTAACHDSKWTAEAIGNILDNAVKYTPKGGRIRLEVRPWQIYTRIEIADTGIGIEPEHYHDIFKRFYRAEEAAGEEGVGLGLYLAQEIIRQEKGYITVRSQKGEGTVFSVFLLSS